jgi:glucose-6-phosphate 1-dehydrogenase
VAARLAIQNWRWAGVPFLIRTGKRLSSTVTEVHVRLKAPPVSLFGDADIAPNTFAFRLSPDVSISLTAVAKRPGAAMRGEEVCLMEHHQGADDMKPYERLLGDALRGDRTLFGDEAGVEASWRVVDAILGQQLPPHVYEPDSWGPTEADAVADAAGWIDSPF